jgi:hypothetical protein
MLDGKTEQLIGSYLISVEIVFVKQRYRPKEA